jgi:hypothetical protein
VSWFVLAFVALGSLYLGASVALSLYHRRNAVPLGEPVSTQLTVEEIRGCYDELDDVTRGLQKHLENFHHLLGSYDAGEAQRWADEGTVWQRQWKVLGKRCRFNEIRGATLRKEFEEMAAAYEELGLIRQSYTNELVRFGKYQAPRLDRIRARIQKTGERISASTAPVGETK